jgi:hypothetical protein
MKPGETMIDFRLAFLFTRYRQVGYASKSLSSGFLPRRMGIARETENWIYLRNPSLM